MIFGLIGVSRDQAESLRAAPALANDLVTVAQKDASDASHKAFLERLPKERRLEIEKRREAREASAQFQEYREQIEQARAKLSCLGTLAPALDLEKSWHILHYVFTGDVGPVSSDGDALLSGEDVGDDMGYGPPRLYDPERTKAFADFLGRQTLEELQARLNYAAMMAAGVYGLPMGQGSQTEFEDGIRREVASYFPQLRDYVTAMASKGNGLLMWLT